MTLLTSEPQWVGILDVKKTNAVLHEILNLGLRDFRKCTFFSTFSSYNTFVVLMYDYLFVLMLGSLIFGDKRVRVSAGTFLKRKLLLYEHNFQWIQNSTFPKEIHVHPNSLINP